MKLLGNLKYETKLKNILEGCNVIFIFFNVLIMLGGFISLTDYNTPGWVGLSLMILPIFCLILFRIFYFALMVLIEISKSLKTK